MEDFVALFVMIIGFLIVLLLPYWFFNYVDHQYKEETKLIDQIHHCWSLGEVANVSRDGVSCEKIK